MLTAIQPSRHQVEYFRKRILIWCRHRERDFSWRESGASGFHVLLSEFLLQRTRAESVAAILPKITERLHGWSDVLETDEVELESLLKPLGLHKRKAVAIKALACVLIERGGKIPSTRYELEQLPGVGQYIASAILATLYGKREPMLDSNMARVLECFFGPRSKADIRDDLDLQILARRVLPKRNPLRFNWAVLDFAAQICRPRHPRCIQCPLRDECAWALQIAVLK